MFFFFFGTKKRADSAESALERLSLFEELLRADIGAQEGQDGVLAQHAAGDAIPIPLAQLLLGEVGADDGGQRAIEAGVDEVVDDRHGELIDHLGAKIVDDKQITPLKKHSIRV